MSSEEEKLPPDLVGEVLSRVPTKSLARFRAVCKNWNTTIWEDKSFLNNYLSRTQPQFILRNNSQICSVHINLDEEDVSPIEVRELTLDLPCVTPTTSLVYCDGFLLSGISKKGFAIWNPWIGQTKWIMSNTREFRFCGVGYDRTRLDTGYKIFGYDYCFDGIDASATTKFSTRHKVVIYDCKTDSWKFANIPSEEGWRVPNLYTMVSMNGNIYWTDYDTKTCKHLIRSFDFSKETFKTLCVLPRFEDFGYIRAFAIFKGDRFSLLGQCYMTNKIEILVTKNKIDGNGEAIEWINFMKVSLPNLPRLIHKCLDSQTSYFIDSVDGNKKLCVCAWDENGRACIYIVKEDGFRAILIEDVVDVWPSHITYIPSFVHVPSSGRSKEERLQKKEILVRSFM